MIPKEKRKKIERRHDSKSTFGWKNLLCPLWNWKVENMSNCYMCNELQVRKRREYWGLLTKNGKQNLKRKNKLKRLAVYQPLQFGGMGK